MTVTANLSACSVCGVALFISAALDAWPPYTCAPCTSERFHTLRGACIQAGDTLADAIDVYLRDGARGITTDRLEAALDQYRAERLALIRAKAGKVAR